MAKGSTRKGGKTTQIGRDAATGLFKPVADARRDKKGSIVETIRRPPKKRK